MGIIIISYWKGINIHENGELKRKIIELQNSK